MREIGSFDRRKYVRIPTRQVVSISQADAAPRSALGKNLSVAGIRFEVIGCEIDLADVLMVHFQHEAQELRALGRVVWCTKEASRVDRLKEVETTTLEQSKATTAQSLL